MSIGCTECGDDYWDRSPGTACPSCGNPLVEYGLDACPENVSRNESHNSNGNRDAPAKGDSDYSDMPTDAHFDAIERAVPPSQFDDFEEQ